MTAPLISDATLARIVRLVDTFTAAREDRWAIVRELIAERYAEALDVVRREDPENANLIEALEEANEEAAVTYDRQETEEHAAACGPLEDQEPSGAVPGTVTMSGEAVLLDGTRLDLSDPEAMKRAADAVRAPFLANFTEVVPPPPFTAEMEARLLKSERDEARAERDGLREQLAAAKKKLQGVMYGGKRRRS